MNIVRARNAGTVAKVQKKTYTSDISLVKMQKYEMI